MLPDLYEVLWGKDLYSDTSPVLKYPLKSEPLLLYHCYQLICGIYRAEDYIYHTTPYAITKEAHPQPYRAIYTHRNPQNLHFLPMAVLSKP